MLFWAGEQMPALDVFVPVGEFHGVELEICCDKITSFVHATSTFIAKNCVFSSGKIRLRDESQKSRIKKKKFA